MTTCDARYGAGPCTKRPRAGRRSFACPEIGFVMIDAKRRKMDAAKDGWFSGCQAQLTCDELEPECVAMGRSSVTSSSTP